MTGQPHVNDYLDALRVPLGKAIDRARRAFEEELNAASRTGLGGNTIRRVLDRLQQEFESSVSAALATLKRAKETTSLDVSELRGLTAQELETFARQLKSTVQTERLSRARPGSRQMAAIDEALAKLDEHLRHSLRQFDVGFFDIAAPRDRVSGGALFNASPLNRFGYNQPPNEHISRDTPLSLRAAAAETPPLHEIVAESGVIFEPTAATGAGSPSQPDPSQWGNTTFDTAAAQNAADNQRRRAAVLSTNDNTLPPLPQSNSNTAAPDEMRTVTVGAFHAVPLEVVSPTFRENAERAETLAHALATTINREVERLKNERLNDPNRQAEIDFLEAVSATLDQIATAIGEARRAAAPQDRDQKFSEAETLAGGLAKACRDFAERNYERITDYGGCSVFVALGTLFFVNLFGVSPEFAMGAQLALLGLSGGTKK
jgi:hypothetical protein